MAPGGNYNGAGYNIAWSPDPDVGIVVECNKVPVSSLGHHAPLNKQCVCKNTQKALRSIWT